MQTAHAIAKGSQGSSVKKVRVLFDSGSQRSFVTARVVNDLKIDAVRSEWLGINTFGQETSEAGLVEVVRLDVFSVKQDEVVKLEFQG